MPTNCPAGDRADRAERLGTELRRWSGAGLTFHGITYFGAADTWLGLLAVVRGQRSAGLRLVESAIAQEPRRGATALEQRATTMHRSIVSEA